MESVEERTEAEDALDAWCAWWESFGARSYAGAVLPPLRLAERALADRRGIGARTYRLRAGRRRQAEGPLPGGGNLRLPLG